MTGALHIVKPALILDQTAKMKLKSRRLVNKKNDDESTDEEATEYGSDRKRNRPYMASEK